MSHPEIDHSYSCNVRVKECIVLVRKLTLTEISRIMINPFLVIHRCNRCKIRMYYGPKCDQCKAFYHYDCALMVDSCCEKKILPPAERLVTFKCPKCNRPVQFGPQCAACKTMFHNNCLNRFDKCCKQALFRAMDRQSVCGKCCKVVHVGPKCPLCRVRYHYPCMEQKFFTCCGVRLEKDEAVKYTCTKCRRPVKFSAPICSFCGIPSHVSCMLRTKLCCGKRFFGDIYIAPSFQLRMVWSNFKVFAPTKIVRSSTGRPRTPETAPDEDPKRCRRPSERLKQKRMLRPKDDKAKEGPPVKRSKTDSARFNFPNLQLSLENSLYDIEVKLEPSSPPPPELREYNAADEPSHSWSPPSPQAKKKPRRRINKPKRKPKRNFTLKKRQGQRSKPPTLAPSAVSPREQASEIQSYSLDHIRIVEVKSESDVFATDSQSRSASPSPPPPVLHPSVPTSSRIPEAPPVLLPSTSAESEHQCHQADDSSDGEDDTLESLFYSLYNVVKKFPPHLQTQVKFELFKSVTDAELKLQLSRLSENSFNLASLSNLTDAS